MAFYIPRSVSRLTGLHHGFAACAKNRAPGQNGNEVGHVIQMEVQKNVHEWE